MTISYRRKGKTAKDWYSSGSAISFPFWKEGTVNFAFEMESKGGGITEVQITVDSEGFRELAKLMIQANRESAISAFGEALQWKPPRYRPNSARALLFK